MNRALAKVKKVTGGNVNLGVAAGPSGARGVVDVAARINEHISLVANGSIANSKDWSTMAGLRVEW